MFLLKIRLFSIILLAFLFLFTNPFVIPCTAKEKSDSELKSEDVNLNGQKDNDAANGSEIPPMKPGEWEPLFDMGKNLFPSVVISTATLKEGGWDDAQHLGDPWGTIGIAVCSPQKNCPVTVEISGETFIKPSTFNGTLAEKGIIYCIYPNLKYNYEKLLSVKQTIPETLSFKISIDGKAKPEETVRVQVRSINECVFYFVDYEGNMNDVSWFFAAYVNENHPVINQILKEALDAERVDSFAGYSGDKEDVMKEIKAIWDTLKNRGMHYSSITVTADDDDPNIGDQHVRLLSESINYSQANCVDGSVLMASILRKIGLDVNLVLLPNHMFIAVNLDENGENFICIETTMLGKYSLDEAIEEGYNQFSESKDKFDSEKEDDEDYYIINIKSARHMGIMPIKDQAAN